MKSIKCAFNGLTYLKLWLLLSLSFFVVACSEDNSEQQIKDQINSMQQAISDKSLSDFMAPFSRHFSGNNGLTKQQLRQQIFFHFRGNRNIESFNWQAEIVVKNDLAEVEIYAVVAAGNKVLPERGRAYQINSSWQKIDGIWLIKKAKWENPKLPFR